LLQAALDGSPPPLPPSITRYLVAGVHKATKTNDPIYIVRAGLSNAPALMSEVSQEEVVAWLMYRREQVFLECDRYTRESGRICKMITVNDMNFLSLSKNDGRFMAALKASSKLSEVYYPQMLRTAVLINVPAFIKVVSRGLMSVMPARTRAKMRVCPGSTLTQDISRCPFARQWLDKAAVPSFLGGTCTCPAAGGCVCGIANDQHAANLRADKEGVCHALVPARGAHEVFLPAVPGCVLAYAYEVERGTLNGHGSLTFSVVLRPEDALDHPAGAGGARDNSADLVLVAPTKTRSDTGRVSGEVGVPQAGMLVITWSNSGAALMSRGLKCAVDLRPPAGSCAGSEGRPSLDRDPHPM